MAIGHINGVFLHLENVWAFCRAKESGRDDGVAVRRGYILELIIKVKV